MTEVLNKLECFKCGQCCRSFYPEIIPPELHRLKKVLPKKKWRELCKHLTSESPYQKEKAFPNSVFIKPRCPLLNEDNLCSIHETWKPNSCQHWFCGRKSPDEPLAPARAVKFWIEGIRLLMKDGSIVDLDPTMTAHLETCAVGGVSHKCLKKDTPADSAGEQAQVSFAAVGYLNFLDEDGEPPGDATLGWAFQLTDVAKILATTWTYYFRAYKTGTSVGHGNLGAQVRKNADNTLRATIIAVTASGDTADFPGAYGTVNGSYAISEYTVVDDTDWLVCYWYAHCTTGTGGKKAYLRYDDNGLAEADQVRITNVSFQTLFIRQLTENLYVIQVPFSWKPKTWIFQLISNLSVISDVFNRVSYLKRKFIQNMSVIADKFSFVPPLVAVYKLAQNLSVISTVPVRIYNAVRPIKLDLSAIRDVFSSILTKVPIVRQFVEMLIMSVSFVRRYSGIRAFKQNLSAIREAFLRRYSVIRKFIAEVIIRDVFSFTYTAYIKIYQFVQNLSVIAEKFTSTYTPLLIPVYQFIENLSTISVKLIRKVAYSRTIREDLGTLAEKFKRIAGRVRKFLEDLVVPTPND